MFDFNVFDSVSASEKGATLHLLHPLTDKPVYSDNEKTKAITISALGPDSQTNQKALQKAHLELRKAHSQLENGEELTMDYDKAVADTVQLYADLCTGFEGITHKGKALKFSRENAVILFDTYKEIRKQFGDFVADKANFIKG